MADKPEKTDAELEIEAVEKVLGEPVFLEFADSTLKARRNLIAFASIAIAFAWWHLTLSSNPTLFGVQLQNLSNEVVAWGLFWSVLYLLWHFAWLAWDSLQEWRLRQTGTRVIFQTATRWDSPGEGGDAPNDPRHSTLYTWWRDQQRLLGHSRQLADDTRETLWPWIDRGLPGDIDDRTKAQLLTISTNVAVLKGSIDHATKVLESHRPNVSLKRFDGAYLRFARSQNLRWIVLEFGLPFLVGLGGLGASIVMIRQPATAALAQAAPVIIAPAASSPASPASSPAPSPLAQPKAPTAAADNPASAASVVATRAAGAQQISAVGANLDGLQRATSHEGGSSGMGSVLAAIIAVSGAIGVGYIANFMADDYRRFRDGSTLAAGLAGELGSYAAAFPMVRAGLGSYIAAVNDGKRADLKLRGIDRPVDLIFERNVERLGLLGTETVESVVFVYGNIRAFRVVFEMIFKEHADMSDAEFKGRCETALATLDRAVQRGEPLVKALRQRAALTFRPTWPWGWSQSKQQSAAERNA